VTTELLTLTCRQCNAGFAAQLPVVSSRSEDQASFAENGDLSASCPSCGAVATSAHPVLLARESPPRLAYIPSDGLTPESNAACAQALLERVAGTGEVTAEIIEAGCSWIPKALTLQLNAPTPDDPDYLLVLAATTAAAAGARVSEAIQGVLGATDPAGLAGVVERYPIMITDAAGDQLDLLIANAEFEPEVRRAADRGPRFSSRSGSTASVGPSISTGRR